MLRKSRSQRDLVNGDGVGDMTLANDAATGSAQGEMNLPSLLRLCVADIPSLVFGEDQIQPRVFHYKQHLRRTPQGTPPTSLLLLLSSRGVALVAKDSFATCSRGVAAKYVPFRTCTRRISLEAFSAEFCATGSSIIPATRPAAFITSLGFCFHHGSDGRA